ncbi:Eaa1 [Klebsiella pneumoniae]|nr:Eaa1 [Klebsiella pneumoniae]
MTKSTITREQITSWMNDANYTLEGPLNADDAAAARAILSMGDELLAAMDSEPVAWTDEEELRDANVAGIGYLFGIDREANKFADPRRQIMLYRHAQPAKSLELAGWQFKSVNGDWLGLIDEHGKNQAVREGCEVREVFAIADGVNDRDKVRQEHAKWSQATFGNVGPVGPLKHLSKEALEAAVQPSDLSEWADMQFLLWDAQRRAGFTDEQITQAMIEKLAVNKQREWPEPKDGEPRLHIKEQPAPVVQCPYPCGWDTLNKLAIQDAAFVALALVAGEPATESIRSAVISNNDRLLKVISFCRDVMPNAEPVVTQKECQKCKGTGIADSGGVQPWGEPISIECDCATSQSIAVMDIDELRLAFEAKERESDEGFNLHKYGIGYADDATQDRWEQWLACRAAMLQAGALTNEGTKQAVNSPAIPDGYVMVPMRLTAENGAKGALSGEFSETKFVNCPECFGDDECETCDGSGRIEITVPVTWTTIKEIWAKGVEHFSATPREVKGE